MRRCAGLFILLNVAFLTIFVCVSLALLPIIAPIFFDRDQFTYSLDEIGQLIHSPIPTDATDVEIDPTTVNGYTIRFSFSAPPSSANQFASNLCQGKLYEGYDPFVASNYYAGYVGDAVIKSSGYTYFSTSTGVSKSIYGNRCSMDIRTGQVRIDKTNPQKYLVRFEILSYTCDVDLMCKAPYGFDNDTYRPLPKNAPFPLTIFGTENTKSVHVPKDNILCAETIPDSFSSWNKVPFNFDEFNGASFELFVDDINKGPAVISKGRLKVDYSTGKFVGLHEPPEYCFAVDAAAGEHQMSINVKTVAGKTYHYAWGFQVQTS